MKKKIATGTSIYIEHIISNLYVFKKTKKKEEKVIKDSRTERSIWKDEKNHTTALKSNWSLIKKKFHEIRKDGISYINEWSYF